MFTRILVPLDGSVLAEDAFPVATRLAHTTGGAVLVVRVVPPPVPCWPSSAPLLPSAAAQTTIEAGRVEATSYLERFLRASHVAGREISGEVHVGPPAATLLSVAEARGVDLIVLSRSGKTGPTRWGLGSVVEKVVHHAAMPVLVLPESMGIVSSEQPWHALVPLDGSSVAEAALAAASCLISALSPPGKATLHLLLVITLPTPPDGKERPGFLDQGMQACLHQETACYLQAVQERFLQDLQADHRVSLTSSFRFGADVAETVLTVAEQGDMAGAIEGVSAQGGNLIAMTTCGRERGGASWMMGHVASRVLRATSLPLLLVPQPHAGRAKNSSTGVEREGAPLSL